MLSLYLIEYFQISCSIKDIINFNFLKIFSRYVYVVMIYEVGDPRLWWVGDRQIYHVEGAWV